MIYSNECGQVGLKLKLLRTNKDEDVFNRCVRVYIFMYVRMF